MPISGVTARGSSAEKVEDTSHALSPDAAIAVGKIAFLVAATDNTTLVSGASTDHTSVADTDGHTWEKLFERTNAGLGAANTGVTLSLWRTKVTAEIGTGDTVTLTIGTARTAKILGLFEATVGAGQTLQVAGTPQHTEGSAADPTDLTLSGLPSNEYLFLGLFGKEINVVTWVEDPDYTNVYATEGIGSSGGGGTTNVSINVGYRILTGTGDTFAPTFGGVADHTGTLLAFEEVSEGGAITLIPVGATSTEAAGSAVLTTDVVLAPAGAAETDTPASATASTDVVLAPSGATSTEAGGSAQLATPVVLAPSGALEVDTAGTAALATAITLIPAGATSTEAAGSAVLSTAIILTPAGALEVDTAGVVELEGTIVAEGPGETDAAGSAVLSTAIILTPAGALEVDTAGSAFVSTGSTATGALELDEAGSAVLSTDVVISASGAVEVDTPGSGTASTDVILAASGSLQVDAAGAVTLSTDVVLDPAGATETDLTGVADLTVTGFLSAAGALEVDLAGSAVLVDVPPDELRLIHVDIEALAIDWLIDSAEVQTVFGADPDTRISAEAPGGEAIAARLTRISTTTPVLRRLTAPVVQVDVWAPTKAAARDGADLLHGRLHDPAIIGSHPAYNAVVTETEDALGIQWFPDGAVSERPRYIFAIRFYCYRTPDV